MDKKIISLSKVTISTNQKGRLWLQKWVDLKKEWLENPSEEEVVAKFEKEGYKFVDFN